MHKHDKSNSRVKFVPQNRILYCFKPISVQLMTQDIVCIIGAGIGGLTTALALQQQGYKVKIFERAQAIKPVGAGIVMANNAMQIFEKLGVRNKIEKAGHKISAMRFTDSLLNPLQTVSLSDFEQKYGVHNVAIHRAELQRILAEAVGYDNILLGKKLIHIERNNGFELSFEDGSKVHTAMLIGADDIQSTVRNMLFNSGTLHDSGQRCWRGLCESNNLALYKHQAVECWGKGKRFGFVIINESKVYWYAVVNHEFASEKANLAQVFDGFHPDILQLIQSTPSEQIHYSDIIDLKPFSSWSQDNVCLIGDAAHATTPNLGQGACQAVEDTYILAKLVSQGYSLKEAFIKYPKLRKNKAHYIVNTSWTLGKVAHLTSAWACNLRNQLLKLTPESMNRKQMDKIFDIHYTI